jgi:CubicO group peptidase (beta-lactamase class C family)
VALQAEVDRCVERAREEWESVGAAVSVTVRGEVVYARGFGAREHGRPEPVDEHSVFQIGSTSKAFACAALGVLVDDGALGWDDRVVDHLPWFRLADPWLTESLTVRDTLTHRSGIALSGYPFFRLSDLDDTVRQLRVVGGALPFRDCFSYDNSMYAVAGRVTEAAAGVSWHAFVKQRLFAPLQMEHSGTSPYDFWDAQFVTPTFFGETPDGSVPSLDQARDGNVAMPHGWDAQGEVAVIPWQSYDNAAAAGAVVSNAADLGNWMAMHLDGGRFGGRQVVSEETLRELHAVQNVRDAEPGYGYLPGDRPGGYALGWRLGTFRGQRLLSHGGGILGFPSHVTLLPEHGLGVTVLSNGSRVRGGDWPRGDVELMNFHKAITLSIFDALLEAEPGDWTARYVARAREAQAELRAAQDALDAARLDDAPARPLGDYAGTYEDTAGASGPVEVTVEGDGLRIRFPGAGAFSAPLEHWHRDVFRVRANPVVADVVETVDFFAFAEFTVGPRGTVTRLAFLGGQFLPKGP